MTRKYKESHLLERIDRATAEAAMGEDDFERIRQAGWRRSAMAQLAVFFIVLPLWPIPLFNPVKLLVVLFHEFSHVCAAWLTGGVVFGVAIDPGGAGVTLGMDGEPITIAAAGYFGSLALGVALYAALVKWNAGDVWCLLLLISLASIALGWLNDFSAVFGYGTIALMVIGYFYFAEKTKRAILRWVATTSCLYSIIDVLGEAFNGQLVDGFVVDGRPAGSDVAQLARLTGIPELVLALFWVILGFAVVGWLVAWSARCDARNEVKQSMLNRALARSFLDNFYVRSDTPPEYRIR